MPDLDQLLTSDISLAASRVVEPVDFGVIERRAQSRARNRAVLGFCAAAVVGVLGLVVSAQASRSGSAPPTVPIQRPTPSPTPGWTGPLRADAAALPVIHTGLDPADTSDNPNRIWADARDVTLGPIDLRRLLFTSGASDNQRVWQLHFQQAPTIADPARGQRVTEYGLVIDTDGDRVADCQVTINDDMPTPGEYRVAVKNLRTGVDAVQAGPPYGYPIEFGGPPSYGDPRAFRLLFLQRPPAPCASFRASAGFYAWTLVTEGGQPRAWDFAPDAGWLRIFN
jgi:hypothetical protein